MPHANLDWQGPSGQEYDVEVEFVVETDDNWGADADNSGGETRHWALDPQFEFEPPIETDEDRGAAIAAEDALLERAFDIWLNNQP